MMKIFKISLLYLLLSSWSIFVSAQGSDTPFSEAPYLFFDQGQWHAKWVEKGELKSEENVTSDFLQNHLGQGLTTNLFISNFQYQPPIAQRFKKVSKITVISDVHGQFGLTVQLLKNHGVIDENLNWIYGRGHLVVNGDVMGRGDEVTELLWLFYKLENQANLQRGKVHYLVGNHELMVLLNDLRYLNEKYVKAAEIMGVGINELYGGNSVLGNWLRKRPAIVTINDNLIVHAGIAPSFIERKLTAKKVNKLFFDQISGFHPANEKQLEEIDFMLSPEGPIWYRGYFIENEVSEQGMEKILNFYKSKRMIIGHTSLPAVSKLYNGKLIAVDSNIKEGVNGEILIIEDGVLYRGSLEGVKFKFP
ncbi:metallophosphoesterase [Shivajiella indica]|uniref:Metallophosphoesterase n=1 Tax=Shivajiella indica TaxID=872115 RepID=A0ABW5B3F8_9BACT